MQLINKAETLKIAGTLQSEKNGIKYDFLFNYHCYYHSQIKAYVYCFEIWEKGLEAEPNFIVLFKIMENETDLKVIDLFPPDYYKGKGISIAIILKVRQLLNKRIISSSNQAKTEIHEARWEDATQKVWNRLIAKGLAEYNKTYDYFFTT